jgi:pimeloyl-ACP methyl ester carboxylesterase
MPTLVLLHEGLGCTALWRDFPGRLAETTGLGVFAYSRAGYGGSDPDPLPWPLDYMTRHATGVLPEVLDAIGLRRGVLIGHSDGATIAAIHAGRVQDARVAGLALMAPHFFTEPMGLAAIAAARQAYDTGDLKPRLARYHADPDCAFRGWNDSWLHPAFKAWNVTEVIGGIRVPVLALQGEADQYGTRAQIDVLAELCPAPVTLRLLPACRHAPFLDAPDVVLSELKRFCAGALRAGATP